MIPPYILKLAEEGGWKDPLTGSVVEGLWEVIALDPSFWKALSKSCGWDEYETVWLHGEIPNKTNLKYIFGQDKKGTNIQNPNTYVLLEGWIYRAIRFYDLILTGGNTDAFWNELQGKK